MRKLILSTMLLFCMSQIARADEGMWFLALMEKQHLADSLKKAGLQLSAEDVYSGKKTSLKDAVGIFGGGCTGEIVSPNGLVLTNNHCGYSYVHAMSTLEANYLQNGYFAHSLKEELPVPRLTFTFLLGVEDVTDKVVEKAKKENVDEYTMQSRRFLNTLSKDIMKSSKYADVPGARVGVYAFYNGNQFYAIFTQTYNDVRLVANPPLQIGQFGQNQDNWVWPRHNADFAMFRVYADKNGNPAPYSEDNVPLKRKKFLHISIADLQEGDYTMIMGFPGSTERYLSAEQLNLLMQSQYKPLVLFGEPVLEQNRKEMARNDSVRLAMQNMNMSLGNVVKNRGGAIESVRQTKLIDKKRVLDAQLLAYAKQKGNDEALLNVLPEIDRLCTTYGDTIFDANLINYTSSYLMPRLDLRVLEKLGKAIDEKNVSASDSILSEIKAYLSDNEARGMEKRYRNLILPILKDNVRLEVSKEYARKLETFVNEEIEGGILGNIEALNAFATSPSVDKITELQNKIKDLQTTRRNLLETTYDVEQQLSLLSKTYTRGILEMNDGQTPPDANFTMRLTYGHIKGYSPRDAVSYNYRTVLDGMLEKENPRDVDYVIDEPLRKLYNERNFGRYARPDGKLPTCFLSDNDITGGNSGSPVMNAKGQLIGLAFDGNIESLASDFAYNPHLQRCINVDIRFVLWVVDIYGGSGYVLKEMKIHDK